MLDGLGFVTFIKTSGRTGLHLYLPIVRDLDFDAARGVAETIARHVQRGAAQGGDRRVGGAAADGKDLLRLQPEQPRQVAGDRRSRRGAIRPRTVSMPIAWDELERVYPTDFTLHTVPDRLEAEGDPWAGILDAQAGSRRRARRERRG